MTTPTPLDQLREQLVEECRRADLDRGLEIAQHVGTLRHASVPGMLNQFAECLKRAGRLQDAHRVSVQALEIAEEILGQDHLDIAAIYHNLADLELVRGRFATGESYARRSAELREALLGPDHAELAETLTTLADLLDGQGRHTESAACRERRRTPGPR